jgi:tetratricopeptide (TPR) repeat protein
MLAESFAGDDLGALRGAMAGYRTALSLWPECMLGARGLERLSQRLGDRPAMSIAQRALAKLVESPVLRAGHLVRAAELASDDGAAPGAPGALELYEEALRSDPDNPQAAKALARMLSTDTGRLGDRLGEALAKARATEQIVLLGTAIGRAALRPSPTGAGPEVGIAIDAMHRVLAELPDDVSGLMLMSSLLREQQLWGDAVAALERVVEVAPSQEQRVAAYFELATIYEGPLDDSSAAENALQAVLSLDAKNRHALERLYQVAAARGDRSLAIQVLVRLADGEADPAARAEYDLRLAEACREAGDKPGMVRALCDAVVSAPNDARANKLLASLQRTDTPDGAAAYAKSLQQVLDIASARRVPFDHRWLTTLGLLEATVLRRPMDGLAHLQQAVALPGAPAETRIALGRGLEAVGRNGEAVQVLRDVLAADVEPQRRGQPNEGVHRISDMSVALTTLESALAKDGRAEERLAVEEVRAVLGEIKGERVARLRGRRLPAEVPFAMSLAGSEIARLLVLEARSPMIDVSVALSPIAAKALRFDLTNLGITSRDRVGPRDGHPTRALADKLARCLGVEAFELYLSPTWQGAARVYPGDPPAIVGPSSLAELPEPEQCFALARLVTRIALGLTWLDELSVEQVDGLLVAAVRTVEPNFGAGEMGPPREAHVQAFLGPVQKAIGRRQRKLLEEIAPNVPPGYDPRAFTIGVRRSEYRTAYVMSGDLVAAIDYLRRFDREIGRSTEEPRVLMAHPVTNELVRFALTAEAHAERRRVGTVWMG